MECASQSRRSCVSTSSGWEDTFIKAVAGQRGYGEGDQQRAADTIELHIDGILTYYDYRISIENEEGNLRKVMIKNVKKMS